MVEADLELGGTDQLFNLLLGRELQKVMGQVPQCVMTLPLIEGLDGVQKMSKSLNNYVGVDEPAREMYGKLMSVPDDLMWKYFEFILCWPKDEVQAMHARVANGELHPRAAKDMLGQAVVTRFVGEAEAKHASEEFTRIFAQKALPDEIPEIVLPAEEIGLLNLMVTAGLVKSNGDARRLVTQGAVKINDEKASDPRMQLVPEEGMVIRSGKRGFVKVKIG
jgi:tyrosyl-tRNA synthetase